MGDGKFPFYRNVNSAKNKNFLTQNSRLSAPAWLCRDWVHGSHLGFD